MQLQLAAYSSSCSGFPLFLLFPILYTISFMTRTTSRSPSSHSHSHYEFICEVFHLNCQYSHWYDKDHLDTYIGDPCQDHFYMKSMKTITVHVSCDVICYIFQQDFSYTLGLHVYIDLYKHGSLGVHHAHFRILQAKLHYSTLGRLSQMDICNQ